MDQSLIDARMAVAAEIGSDVGSFTPPDEKRFTGIEIMLGIGAAMLYAFFKGLGAGVAEKVGNKVGEKIGEPLAEYVGKKIDELTGKDKASDERSLEKARDEARTIVQSAALKDDELIAIARAVEKEIVVTLSEKAPEDVSVRIARTVRISGLKAL